MAIRLIAVDLDGTLFTTEKTIDARTDAALKAAAACGIVLAFATGRTGVEVEAVRRTAPCVRYGVLCNGAFVRDLQAGATLAEEALPMEMAREVLRRAAQAFLPEHADFTEICMPELFCAHEIYTEARCLSHAGDYGMSPELAQLVCGTRTPCPDFHAFCTARTESAGKVNLWFRTAALRDAAHAATADLPCTITRQESTNLEFNRAGVDKGLGLAHLASALGIAQDEVMAIGDNSNDLAMLRWAGLGVAMANGTDEAKAAANVCTDSNDDAGVGKAIERWALA